MSLERHETAVVPEFWSMSSDSKSCYLAGETQENVYDIFFTHVSTSHGPDPLGFISHENLVEAER